MTVLVGDVATLDALLNSDNAPLAISRADAAGLTPVHVAALLCTQASQTYLPTYSLGLTPVHVAALLCTQASRTYLPTYSRTY